MNSILETRRTERARENRLREALRANARAIGEHAGDDESLIGLLATRRLALLGEASHGTHEFHEQRSGLTKRLIVDSERMSHHFHARLAAQFDAVLHLDVTSALAPLDPAAHWRIDEVPESFPSGV